MKRVSFVISLTLLACLSMYGQRLSLTDLANLCNKKNWEDVNHTLLAKGWVYYDSEKGDTYKYNTITWSYKKDYYDDKAQAWFYLFTYEGFPNKISYAVFNKESYSLIQNSIASAGFKLIESEIEDNELSSIYGNSSFTLKISTLKRKDSDWSSRSMTAYNITLIKKAGIYDADNGKKIVYDDDDVVQAEYTLSNGKLNGQLKVYHPNGKLKKTGNYINGVQNGLFKEYDEDGELEREYSMKNDELDGPYKSYHTNGKLRMSGHYIKGKRNGNFVEYDIYGNKEAEYVMVNDLKNGLIKIYNNGKIDVSSTLKDDIKNGQHIEYYYDDETGNLQLKHIGQYVNDEKSGTWKLYFVEKDNTERLLTFENFTRDIKNGSFQELKGDTLIVGSYRNDKLHGDYKVYRDYMRSLFGTSIRTNINELVLTSDGFYNEGLKSGYWKNYDLTETLVNEGKYTNDQKSGEWKYYYTNWSDGEGGILPYSKQLFLTENYLNGKLEGKSTRFSFLEKEEYPCQEFDEDNTPIDTCIRYIHKVVHETTFYKNGLLNGPYELRDSINEIVVKGDFREDLKEGEWIERSSHKWFNDEVYFIYQKGNYNKDKRDGKWIEHNAEGQLLKTFHFINDDLHGEYVIWNRNNNPKEKKLFNYGQMTELITYDSLGVKPVKKYEIFEQHPNYMKCRKVMYFENGYNSQEYWVNIGNEFDHELFVVNFSVAFNSKISSRNWGYKDGYYHQYDLNNKPLISGKYYKEDRVGLWIYYFYDQNVKIESNFSDDKPTDEKYLKLNGEVYSGDFVYFDLDNNIKEERRIKDGLRNGKTNYIDIKTNKSIKKEIYKNGELK